MITIPLSADALAATRFAVSPLMHFGAVLHPCRPNAVPYGSLPNGEVTDALQEKQLHLLAAVRNMTHIFAPVFTAPVFLTPPTPAGRPADPHDDLHRVATAPSHLVARQISRLLGVEPPQIPAASAALRTVREAVDRGERDFADRLAREMDVFWNGHLARQWSAAAHAEEDITLRTRLLADHGMGGALESLHEAFLYGDGSLRLLDRLSTEVSGGRSLVLFPSPLAHNWLLSVDPRGERPVYLIYPTRPRSVTVRPSHAAEKALSDVIGPTRFALLADLDVPRTTTQLAALHHLSPSTVSYHLARLHRAGPRPPVGRGRAAHRGGPARTARTASTGPRARTAPMVRRARRGRPVRPDRPARTGRTGKRAKTGPLVATARRAPTATRYRRPTTTPTPSCAGRTRHRPQMARRRARASSGCRRTAAAHNDLRPCLASWPGRGVFVMPAGSDD